MTVLIVISVVSFAWWGVQALLFLRARWSLHRVGTVDPTMPPGCRQNFALLKPLTGSPPAAEACQG